MKRIHQPSGLQRGLGLRIDPEWSPEQAMAIIELLDDLRDRIWVRYETVLRRKFRDDRVSQCRVKVTDPPF
jgi:hypothetical protein